MNTAADNQRRADVAGQVSGEHEHAGAGRHDAGEEHQVVDEDRIDARPQEGRGDDPFEQHRVGVGQRARVRVEDVGVEEVARVLPQRVRNPRQAPDAEQGIVVRPARACPGAAPPATSR